MDVATYIYTLIDVRKQFIVFMVSGGDSATIIIRHGVVVYRMFIDIGYTLYTFIDRVHYFVNQHVEYCRCLFEVL